MNSFFKVSNLLSATTPRLPARAMFTTDIDDRKTANDVYVAGFPPNTVIALDVHGTLISRNQADDLRVVQAFRETVSGPARAGGVTVIMASAAPTRELQRVASLLDLGDQPAVAELGHVFMPRALETPPRLASSVTPEVLRLLLNLKRWLIKEGLPQGVFFEPKTVLVTLNWSEAPLERDRLVESIEAYICRHRLPLYVSVSDATIDIGIAGVNKASGLATVIAGLGLAGERTIVAVGDSRNDMDLLAVASPGFCGCPANCHPDVREYVRSRSGIVSESRNLAGTLDVLTQLAARMSPRPRTLSHAVYSAETLVCEWRVRTAP
jgi:hydroxymethylpyrimidine pyrophosphatase-like HAD family hydrolase